MARAEYRDWPPRVVRGSACQAAISALSYQRLLDRVMVQRQSQTIGLLLNAFEESAADWLWETDAAGTLLHAPVRMAAALSVPADQLPGMAMAELLRSYACNKDDSNGTAEARTNAPMRSTSITLRNRAASWAEPSRVTVREPTTIPAQLTRMRAAPSARSTPSSPAATLAGSATSTRKNRPPSRSASARSAISFKSTITSPAPSAVKARATASPNPNAPPATIVPQSLHTALLP